MTGVPNQAGRPKNENSATLDEHPFYRHYDQQNDPSASRLT